MPPYNFPATASSSFTSDRHDSAVGPHTRIPTRSRRVGHCACGRQPPLLIKPQVVEVRSAPLSALRVRLRSSADLIRFGQPVSFPLQSICYHPPPTQKTQHLDGKFHWLRQQVVHDKSLKLVYIPTAQQAADFLTKACPRVLVRRFLHALDGSAPDVVDSSVLSGSAPAGAVGTALHGPSPFVTKIPLLQYWAPAVNRQPGFRREDS